MNEELVQLVDEQGRPAGEAARSLCHGDPRLIQAVVHLHLLDGEGRLYLQRRAGSKDRFPGRWDTAVGGHLAPGETPQQALRREAREELGLELAAPDSPGEPAEAPGSPGEAPGSPAAGSDSPAEAPGSPAAIPGSHAAAPGPSSAAPESLEPYLYRDETETEFVFAFKMVYGGPLRPNPAEVEEGVFLPLEEVRRRLAGQPQAFTPHFRASFQRFFVCG